MPRPPRAAPAGVIAHVVTRGNGRMTVFQSPAEFDEFVDLLRESSRRFGVNFLGWCVMPNHIHLLVRPKLNGALSRLMHWLLSTHAHRYRSARADTGHVWQGRFKSFPVESDRQFLTVLRYVERNPVRAALVDRACAWPWSSLRERASPGMSGDFLAPSPLPLPQPWTTFVDEPLTASELARVRESVRRGRPLGSDPWERQVVTRLQLESTVRPRGRPTVRKGA